MNIINYINRYFKENHINNVVHYLSEYNDMNMREILIDVVKKNKKYIDFDDNGNVLCKKCSGCKYCVGCTNCVNCYECVKCNSLYNASHKSYVNKGIY